MLSHYILLSGLTTIFLVPLLEVRWWLQLNCKTGRPLCHFLPPPNVSPNVDVACAGYHHCRRQEGWVGGGVGRFDF